MRVIIAAGGTGGHLYPALAIAQELERQSPNSEILFVGKHFGPETSIVPIHGFDIQTIRIQGFNRDSMTKNLALPLILPLAFFGALRIINRFKPDLVLGMAGYAMVPSVAVAQLKQIPYILHEQNVIPGLATRLFASQARAVCITFNSTNMPNVETVWTGLPLRSGFELSSPQVPPRRLLIVGGSQGSRHLNHTVWEALEALLERFEEIVHVVGREGAKELPKALPKAYRPIAYSDDMPELLSQTDLVISRAGVGTLTEISACGLPSILVPGSFGGRHQEANAQAFVDSGASVAIKNDDFSAKSLIAAVDAFRPEELQKMALAARGMYAEDAARRVVEVMERYGF